MHIPEVHNFLLVGTIIAFALLFQPVRFLKCTSPGAQLLAGRDYCLCLTVPASQVLQVHRPRCTSFCAGREELARVAFALQCQLCNQSSSSSAWAQAHDFAGCAHELSAGTLGSHGLCLTTLAQSVQFCT